MPESPKEFSEFIAGIARGAFDEEASEQMRKLVKEIQRVADTAGGKPKGTISLKIDFTLDRGVFDVVPKLNVTQPAPVRARTIMYGTPDGRLTKEDSRQGALALTGDVKDGTPDVRDIRTAGPRS